MTETFLILTVAGHRVAMSAKSVESVVEIDEIVPVPLVQEHVAGLFALRSRVMTVIDSMASLECGRTAYSGLAQAVIVNNDGHGYALLVDSVEDVVVVEDGVSQTRAVLGSGWSRVVSGEIIIDGSVVLVLDSEAMIAGPRALAA